MEQFVMHAASFASSSIGTMADCKKRYYDLIALLI